MKAGVLMLVAAAMLWCSCAASQLPTGNDPSVGAPAEGAASMNARRDIVLAVANPIAPPAMHAGSSLLGYSLAGNYGAGQRAASLLGALKQQYGWRKIKGWPIKSLNLYCIVLQPPGGTTREHMLKMLAKDKRVKLSEPLQNFQTYSDGKPSGQHYNDPYVDLQRGFVQTDAAAAQDFTRGRGVEIAIVDTGVDIKHPDLRGRIRATYNEVDDDPSAFDSDHHGTEVAGIIAADADNHLGIVGMAPEATLSVYKACWYPANHDAGANCNTFTLAKALAAVMNNSRARIVNLSLGGPADSLLDHLLGQLVDQGRIVIAAMPPNGSLDGFPDDVPGVIVVHSSGASTSTPGALGAPGNDILTTQPDGGYDFSSGSSMAAAHVSGIAALLLSLEPGLGAREFRDLLLRTSRSSDGMLQVNAAAAVMALRGSEELTVH